MAEAVGAAQAVALDQRTDRADQQRGQRHQVEEERQREAGRRRAQFHPEPRPQQIDVDQFARRQQALVVEDAADERHRRIADAVAAQANVQPVVHAGGGIEFHRRLAQEDVALQPLHRRFVGHGQIFHEQRDHAEAHDKHEQTLHHFREFPAVVDERQSDLEGAGFPERMLGAVFALNGHGYQIVS